VSEPPILVVDDAASILLTKVEILHLVGYSVESATNGAEALEVVARRSPSLVLLDMRMPVLDGWGFARSLKERGIMLPIVVMTAAQDAGRWAREIGAMAYLAKPFEIPELLETVERVRQGFGHSRENTSG